MSQDINLKEIERKAWTSYFHDGLWDIYGGFLLLGLGLTMVTDQDWWLGVMILGMLPLWAKKRITYPRMGYVKFSPQRQAKTKKSKLVAGIVLSGTALLGMIMFLLVSTNSLPQWLDAWLADYFLVAFGAMLAAIVGIGAYMVGVTRYYAYAVLVLLAFATGQLLNTSAGLPVTIAAGVMLLCGLVLVIRFIRKYPLPAKEGSDDNQ